MSSHSVAIPLGAKLTIEFEYQGKAVKLKANLNDAYLVANYKQAPPIDLFDNYKVYGWDEIESMTLTWPVDEEAYRLEVDND